MITSKYLSVCNVKHAGHQTEAVNPNFSGKISFHVTESFGCGSYFRIPVLHDEENHRSIWIHLEIADCPLVSIGETKQKVSANWSVGEGGASGEARNFKYV